MVKNSFIRPGNNLDTDLHFSNIRSPNKGASYFCIKIAARDLGNNISKENT